MEGADAEIPTLGLGTYRNTDPAECTESVRTALDVGYRHVDTAQFYENERAVGRGIATSDVPREAVFLATKVWYDSLGYEDVIHSTRESLNRLGVDTIDLLYVHWPTDTYDPVATFDAFEHLHDEGLIEYVGVSNFTPEQLTTAREHCAVPIAANQVECHPYLPQERLREYCATHDITLVGYSPLARGALFDDPTLASIAAAHDATVPQVALAWLRQKGVVAIPKATSREHIRANWASLELSLSADDLAAIDAIEHTERVVDPGFAPW
jgi:2,5-diketo-D-gluconate reductase B